MRRNKIYHVRVFVHRKNQIHACLPTLMARRPNASNKVLQANIEASSCACRNSHDFDGQLESVSVDSSRIEKLIFKNVKRGGQLPEFPPIGAGLGP